MVREHLRLHQNILEMAPAASSLQVQPTPEKPHDLPIERRKPSKFGNLVSLYVYYSRSLEPKTLTYNRVTPVTWHFILWFSPIFALFFAWRDPRLLVYHIMRDNYGEQCAGPKFS